MQKLKNKINDTLLAAVLICSILKDYNDGRKSPQLSENELIEILTTDDMVGLITIYDALSLIEKKSLANISDNQLFTLTEAGNMILDEFINKIPNEILEKCRILAKNSAELSGLRKSVKWDIEKLNQGYSFKLRFLNELGEGDIIDLKIYAPSYESALKMQKNFLEKPIETFERIMYIFTKD